MVGSLLTARFGGRRPVGPVLLGGNAITGVCLLLVSSVDVVEALVAISLVAGVAQSLVLVTYITLRTAYSPDELLGRIGSTARTISLGLQPLGLVVGGALIDLVGGSRTFALMGLAVLTLCAVATPVRALRGASLAGR